jgi:hypothetical protein
MPAFVDTDLTLRDSLIDREHLVIFMLLLLVVGVATCVRVVDGWCERRALANVKAE